MKILLLGGSGLLGHNVLHELLFRGHEPVALVRQHGSIQGFGQSVHEYIGSLLDYDTLVDASKGCEAIINCAGVTDMSLLHYDDYLPVNYNVCGLLIRLMHATGIRRLVHVSTANTIGYGSRQAPSSEDSEMLEPFVSSFYARSKRAGEKLLLDEALHWQEAHIVVVNPGFIVGAYDVKPSSGKLLLAAYRKPFMVAPSGGKSFIAAQAAAVAVVNAVHLGQSGQRYLLTGENLSLANFYRLQAKTCGYRQQLWILPDALVSLAGRLGDLLRWLGFRTQLSSRNVRQLLVREYYDGSRAQNELGMPVVSIQQAIRDFFGWRQCH